MPFSTPIPMALYPTLATLLTTSGLAVTALFYVCVAVAPTCTASDHVQVCRPLNSATACLAAWLPRRTGITLYVLHFMCRCACTAACSWLSSGKARVACAGRYEVTRARPSRRLVEEVGMGLAASTLLVRPAEQPGRI